MRYILGICAVLAVTLLMGAVGTASAYQQPATGRTTPPPPAAATATTSPTQVPAGSPTTTTSPGSSLTAPGNLEQQANERAGTVIDRVAPGATTTAAPNAYQAPGVSGVSPTTPGGVTSPAPGTVVNPGTGTSAAYGGAYPSAAQPGTVTTAPGAYAPGTVYGGTTPYRGYSSNYVTGAPPARTPVTPMAEIPYYNSFYGAGGVQPGVASPGYVTYPAGTTGYSSRYVSPGYGYGTTNYAPARRGPFGLFGRRNRQVYTAGPSGMTYGSAPYGYTYGTAPYNYGYSTPGTYSYGAAPR